VRLFGVTAPGLVPERGAAHGAYHLLLLVAAWASRVVEGVLEGEFVSADLVWIDFIGDFPAIVIDPVGGLINEFLDGNVPTSKRNQLVLWLGCDMRTWRFTI